MRAMFIQSAIVVAGWGIWLSWLGFSGALSTLEAYYPISITMLLGSFVAGSTSVGGGAVAFPVLTKILQVDPQISLVFSLAIQSVGMTAASLMIVLTRIPVNYRIIMLATVAGGFGLLVGFLGLGSVVSGAGIKVIFSGFSFFVALALVWNEFSIYSNQHDQSSKPLKLHYILVAGFLGGVLSGLIGTGIDFIIFTLMIFASGSDLKEATATSVVVMAANAVIGFVVILFATDRFAGEVVGYWLAAVPIVILGAPLGALACRYLHRDIMFYFLLSLLTVDIVSTILILGLTWWYMAAALVLASTLFGWKWRTRFGISAN